MGFEYALLSRVLSICFLLLFIKSLGEKEDGQDERSTALLLAPTFRD
jgi:hypothetical protein